MFSGCSLIISLPDISGWDISNVNDMSCIFSGCNSLLSLLDISKLKIKDVKNISGMFLDVIYYYLYLIYQNGMFQMFMI